jgi:hypothetical protein
LATRVTTLAPNLSDPLFAKASGLVFVNDHGLTESNVVPCVAPNAAAIRVARFITRTFEVIFIRTAETKIANTTELGRLFTSSISVGTLRRKIHSTELVVVAVSVSLTELSWYILAVTVRNLTSLRARRVFIATLRAGAIGDIANLSF